MTPNERTEGGKAAFRAVAILKAKAGKEAELLAFTLRVAPTIRQVKGLLRLEINRAIDDRGRLVLYYWWVSPEDSSAYVTGPVYAALAPQLMELVAEHQLIIADHLDG